MLNKEVQQMMQDRIDEDFKEALNQYSQERIAFKFKQKLVNRISSQRSPELIRLAIGVREHAKMSR